MVVADSITNVFSIADHIGAIIVGNMNDARYLVTYLRNTAAEFKYKYQYAVPVTVLANRMAQYL